MNEAGLAGCTIIAKCQLSAARVLAESWQRNYPHSSFFVLLLDSPAGFFQPARELFHVISPAQLEIANLPGFFFRYSQSEAAGAAKPFFFQHLLDRQQVEKLVYLGPESLLLAPLDEVAELLDKADVVLAAQVTERSAADKTRPANPEYLRWGLFSPDFMALRQSSNARQVLQWWSDNLVESWKFSEEDEVRAERWIDMFPEVFKGIEVLRGPEHNLWYENVQGRQVKMEQGKLSVNGRPAPLFNSRGFEPSESRTELAADVAGFGQLAGLISSYRDLLTRAGWRETSGWTYTHDFFRSGPKIPASARRYYRRLRSLADELPDPFTWIDDAEAAYESNAASPSALGQLPFGMNVLGHLRSEKGVGEMVRSNLRVLKAAGIPHVANDFADPGSENVDEGRIETSSENPYRLNLITINAKELSYVVQQNPQYLRGRFNIGYWAWELAEFPHEWATAFGHLDEVWTLSRFARDSIAAATRVPVQVVHCSLDLESVPGPEWSRASFDIAEDPFVFLFLFDFHSLMERKNPLGLIRAFTAAFGDRRDVLLVIKSSHGHLYPAEMKTLMEAASGANVRIIDKVTPREEKNGLINIADCYVSLHRAEGFGLTLAEAMFYGKPVIGTNYSGNTDFMNAENSFLVPYRLSTIQQSHGPYKMGAVWAEPDLDYAADLMRYVDEHRDKAAVIGRRGQLYVSEVLSPGRIGVSVRSRLEELGMGPEYSETNRE